MLALLGDQLYPASWSRRRRTVIEAASWLDAAEITEGPGAGWRRAPGRESGPATNPGAGLIGRRQLALRPRVAHDGLRMPSAPLIAPMLVSTGPVPRDALWELKWDGFRSCVVLDGEGGIRVATRTGRLVQGALPELAPMAIYGHAMVLDGELVAGERNAAELLPFGGPPRSKPATGCGRGMQTSPITFVIFDLLWLDGRPMLDEPYGDRRAQLEDLALRGPNWATSVTYDGGDALLAAAAQLGAEGVVAKARSGRLARYVPGTRSPGWVKRKCDGWYRDHAPRRRPGGWARAS